MRLYDTDGRRLYLNAEERVAFLTAAAVAPPKTRLFAETLHYTGCRLSEALALTPERVDLSEGRIIFNSLKKRRDDVYRSVPVPKDYLTRLELTFGLRQAQKRPKKKAERLWTWSLAAHQRADGSGRYRRRSSPDAERTASCLRHQRDRQGGAAEHPAKMAGACPAHHHRHLCKCRWQGRGRARREDVGLMPIKPARD